MLFRLASVLNVATAFVVTTRQTNFNPTITTKKVSTSTALFNNNGPVIGAGGMADTRDPEAQDNEDPRKSISAAPSFEEYLKMRDGGGGTAAAPVTVPAAVVAPPIVAPTVPVVQQQQPVVAPVVPVAVTAVAAGAAGGGDAVATLEASQAATINNIASAIPDLAPKPDFIWTAADGVTVDGGCVTTVDARDAPGPANIAWMAGLCVESKMSSLTIFNGPMTDIPHLVSQCVVSHDNQLQFKLDFRPRCYGAYEMKRPDGTYPGPDELGRKSFEYSGARKEFESKFGNDEMQEFLSSTLASFDGATPYDPNQSELDLLTRGPLFTSVTMPNTAANVAAVVAARENAANLWLSWTKDNQHEHRPGAPVNTQYVYDTKFKQNAYGALLGEYSNIYGPEDGQKLAVGESGPLDEGYVGGGS